MHTRFRHLTFALLPLTLLGACAVRADTTTSYTGSLASSSDTYSLVFNVGGTTSEDVAIQTWSFGGGTNAHGQVIAAGGFDPFVGIFSGTGSAASIVTDGMGNPYGTSDALSNYGSFAGCPPAGTVDLGGAVCGDITMSLALAPGAYTLVLSDALNAANAVYDNGTLGEGFSDFTGGAFQTCNTNDSGATTCATDTANYAFDLTIGSSTTGGGGGGGGTSVPEPSSLALVAVSLGAAAFLRRAK
jgi:hypothetical protein